MDARSAVRTILPRQAADIAKDLVLRSVRRQTVDVSKFRSVADIDVGGMFGRPEIEAAWQEDDARIAKEFGREHLWGGINPGDRKAVYFLMLALAPVRVLEVGTHIGASTLYIATALARLGGERKVTTVDIFDVNDPRTGAWREVGLPQPPRDFVRDLGLVDVVEFVTMPVLTHLHQTTTSYDFIFLDGDHRSQAVYREVAEASQHLTPNGTVLLHDFYPGGRPLFPDGYIDRGPWKAAERLRRENADIAVVPLGSLPWPTKQGSQVTSLALISRTT